MFLRNYLLRNSDCIFTCVSDITYVTGHWLTYAQTSMIWGMVDNRLLSPPTISPPTLKFVMSNVSIFEVFKCFILSVIYDRQKLYL
jgi:hypothetical protein